MAGFVRASVTAEGRTLGYVEAGDGPVLAVLDGLSGLRPGSLHVQLAATRRVIVFARPDADGAAAARLVAAGLGALGIEAFDLMAHGAGAGTALWLALLRPRAVRSVILVAPLALGAAAPLAGLTAAALHAHPERHPAPPLPVRGLADPGALEQRMADIEAPVLALFGTEDPLAPPEWGDRYRARLAACNLMFVYDAAHLVDFDRPEAVAFIAGEFLDRKDQFLVSREDGRIFP
ncbi:MAG: alpha/beta fold hydrolase [Stellaceae bacterium]